MRIHDRICCSTGGSALYIYIYNTSVEILSVLYTESFDDFKMIRQSLNHLPRSYTQSSHFSTLLSSRKFDFSITESRPEILTRKHGPICYYFSASARETSRVQFTIFQSEYENLPHPNLLNDDCSWEPTIGKLGGQKR